MTKRDALFIVFNTLEHLKERCENSVT